MRVGVLAHTTVSDGHRARAASSVVYSPARGDGAPLRPLRKLEPTAATTGTGSLTERRALGLGRGRRGAKPPEGAAAEPWRVRHCDKNCGQLWPPVVPAALASFHWLAHCLMTLWPQRRRLTPARKLAPTAATMGRGSLTEGRARRGAGVDAGCPGAYGIAPGTAASSGRQSLPLPEPVSIGWRKPHDAFSVRRVGTRNGEPKRRSLQPSKELNELRMSLPETAPRTGRGVTLSRAEPLRQAHLLVLAVFPFGRASCGPRHSPLRSLTKRRFA